MAQITFDVRYRFGAPPQVVWDELVDWKGHEAWVPLTRVEVEPGDPTAVGTEFTAWTGVGPLSLKDHMRVTQCDWDPSSSSGRCEVEKLGPVLRGTAGFTVEPGGAAADDSADLVWFERISVKYVPQFLAPLLGKIGAMGFTQGMKRLDKQVTSRQPS